MSTGRVMAVYRRFFYSSIHSPPLLFDILLWPLLDLLIWGLLTRFIETSGTKLPLPVGFLLGGVLIWDLLFRANQGISLAFLDDSAWSRNALNVFASPLRPLEYLAGATLWMLAKVAVGWSVMAIGAYLLFSFGVLEIGWALIPFILAAMLFGVVMSLMVVGLILRFGNTAEIFAWGIAEIVSPLCAVYYPLSVLPGWAQTIAWWLPPSHVFEGMRAVLAGKPLPLTSLAIALALDVIYLVGAFFFANAMLRQLRRRGLVTRYM
jgi:ABC-2 type transport system permease protein